MTPSVRVDSPDEEAPQSLQQSRYGKALRSLGLRCATSCISRTGSGCGSSRSRSTGSFLHSTCILQIQIQQNVRLLRSTSVIRTPHPWSRRKYWETDGLRFASGVRDL